MRGLRCAGSVFRNPPGGPAGRLIEQAGLKGARTGGAAVSSRHANVIVTEPGARSSDVRALLERIRVEVGSGTGALLEPEIVFL
jgi:UDP-N-acetylmuramate dehydrogenase